MSRQEECQKASALGSGLVKEQVFGTTVADVEPPTSPRFSRRCQEESALAMVNTKVQWTLW